MNCWNLLFEFNDWNLFDLLAEILNALYLFFSSKNSHKNLEMLINLSKLFENSMHRQKNLFTHNRRVSRQNRSNKSEDWTIVGAKIWSLLRWCNFGLSNFYVKYYRISARVKMKWNMFTNSVAAKLIFYFILEKNSLLKMEHSIDVVLSSEELRLNPFAEELCARIKRRNFR